MTAEGEGVLKDGEKAVMSGDSREHITNPPALTMAATLKMHERCPVTRATGPQHASYKLLHVLH